MEYVMKLDNTIYIAYKYVKIRTLDPLIHPFMKKQNYKHTTCSSDRKHTFLFPL